MITSRRISCLAALILCLLGSSDALQSHPYTGRSVGDRHHHSINACIFDKKHDIFSMFQPVINLKPHLTPSTRSTTSMQMFKVASLSDPMFAAAVASKLYPASMLPTLFEAYFRTRNEMECPRGAVVGFFSQIVTIIISIPMIEIAKRTVGVTSILEIDWLHFTEAFLFWSSIHVQCMSFRQSVRAIEKDTPLPVSLNHYTYAFTNA